ncbi:hypothetical protein Hamer_G004991 [Homarus americanus]|uniref:Uncharacterized protein n=1 Tax=Homarus americanus TaxID=6706 RepID=A0A8J5JY68_HOMAM|nr:hypothetical protein Hamer_G004991 [Homarus americanus]
MIGLKIRPLWPECVLQRDFEGFEELDEEAVVHESVCLGNSMGLEVDDDDDVEELVEEHSKELSTEELLELHKEQNETLKWSLTSEESGEEDKEESRIIPAKDLKDAFFCWSKLSKLAEDYHPDVGSVQKAISEGMSDMQANEIEEHLGSHAEEEPIRSSSDDESEDKDEQERDHRCYSCLEHLPTTLHQQPGATSQDVLKSPTSSSNIDEPEEVQEESGPMSPSSSMKVELQCYLDVPNGVEASENSVSASEVSRETLRVHSGELSPPNVSSSRPRLLRDIVSEILLLSAMVS